MARPAEFTDERIRAKIEEMAAAGSHLTAFAVRRALGGGNMNRIAGILAEWEAMAAPASTETATVELPVELQAEVDTRMAELTAGLSSTIARIHRRATEIAEGRVTEAVKAARAAATAAEAELADAREVLAESDAEVDELEQQLDQVRQSETRLRDECVEVKERLAAMTERAETAERQLAEMVGRLDALVKEADGARERAAAAEATAKEADAERQRALDREHQLTEQMTALRSFLESQFDQLRK